MGCVFGWATLFLKTQFQFSLVIIVSLISMLIVTVLWMPRICLMKWLNKDLFLEHHDIGLCKCGGKL